MDRKDLKLAAYLDEISDDPETACKLLSGYGISYVALRHIWSNSISKITDLGHKRLLKILASNNISTILIASELGKNSDIEHDDLDKLINICKYYNAPYLRLFIRDNIKYDNLARIADTCYFQNVIPLIEQSPDSHICKPTDVAQALTHRCKLLYDPAVLIAKQNVDPFTKYWSLLKNNIAAIDIRDVKIGRGYKPPGFGDAKLDITIDDAITSNYNGWFIMEPSLGRRYGTAVTKAETFQYAIDGLDRILKSRGQNVEHK